MSIFRNLFQSDPNAKHIKRLAKGLTSTHEQTYLEALQESVDRSNRGDVTGVKAMREAIKKKCGKSDVKFFRPGIAMRQMDEVLDAKESILELARQNRLMTDPYQTGNLISAFTSVHGDSGAGSILDEIFDNCSAQAGYDFQILFNEIVSTVKLIQMGNES